MTVRSAYVLGAMGLGLVLWASFRFWPLVQCEQTRLYTLESPEHGAFATAVLSDCGTTTPRSLCVAVSRKPPGHRVRDEDVVFVIDDTAGTTIRWRARDTLVIVSGEGRVFRALARMGAVTVAYE